MNIRTAAAHLNTTPKALRRYLRRHPGFGTIGVDGMYDLTPNQVKALKDKVPIVKEDNMPFPELDSDPGFSPDQLHEMRYNPKVRQEVLKRRSERRERLLTRLADPEVQAFCEATRRAERLLEDSIMASETA